MHIKKVIIRGFKSYAFQADFDPFHSRTNIIGMFNSLNTAVASFPMLSLTNLYEIVGRNGAGKSNFIEGML